MINRMSTPLAMIAMSLVLVFAGCDPTGVLSTFPLMGNEITSTGGGSTPTDNGTVRNAPALTQTLAVQTQGQGTVSMDPPGGSYSHDSIVTLEAKPEAGWQFKYWTTATNNVEVWFQIPLNPAVVVMNEDKEVFAVFAPITGGPTPTPTPTATPTPTPSPSPAAGFTLTLVAEGSGSLTAYPPGPSYTSGTVVYLTATANTGWVFQYWQGIASDNGTTATVIMDSDKTVTGYFVEAPLTLTPTPTPSPSPGPSFTLTLTAAGSGSLTAYPPGPSYAGGTVVYLTAAANSGWAFEYWQGVTSDNGTTAMVVMDGDKTVTGYFVETPPTNQVAQPQVLPRYSSVFTFTHSIDYDITCATPGATIYYTTDGSDPDNNSTWYNPTDYYTHYVLVTTTIKARAYLAGMDPSPIGSATFTQVPATEFYLSTYSMGGGFISVDPPGMTQSAGSSVQLTAVPDPGYHFVQWQIDLTGSTNPVTITMDSDKFVEAIFVPDLSVPYISPPGGTFIESVMVGIVPSGLNPGGFIRYTTDGTDPNDNSTIYDNTSLIFTAATTLKARAFAPGTSPSAVVSADFIIKAGAPIIDPPGGAFAGVQSVTITAPNPSATIHYTYNGVDILLYNGPISVDDNATIKAWADVPGMVTSDTTVAVFTTNPAARPTFSPDGGSFTSQLTASIDCTTSGAIIRYTLDGSDPNDNSTVYTGPVIVDHYLTLKARAWASGYDPSPIASAVFDVSTSPVLTDNNSQAMIDPVMGMSSWMVDAFDHFFKTSTTHGGQTFWYRIGSDGPEQPISVLPLVMIVDSDLNGDGMPDAMLLRYQAAGQFQVDVTYALTGYTPGTSMSTIAQTVRVTNLSGGDLDFHLFQYTDLDVRGTADNNVATLRDPGDVRQRDAIGAYVEFLVAPAADHWEISLASSILDGFNDAAATTLADDSGPVGPADVAWALEWDRVLTPSGIDSTLVVNGSLISNPVP